MQRKRALTLEEFEKLHLNDEDKVDSVGISPVPKETAVEYKERVRLARKLGGELRKMRQEMREQGFRPGE